MSQSEEYKKNCITWLIFTNATGVEGKHGYLANSYICFSHRMLECLYYVRGNLRWDIRAFFWHLKQLLKPRARKDKYSYRRNNWFEWIQEGIFVIAPYSEKRVARKHGRTKCTLINQKRRNRDTIQRNSVTFIVNRSPVSDAQKLFWGVSDYKCCSVMFYKGTLHLTIDHCGAHMSCADTNLGVYVNDCTQAQKRIK